MYSVKSARESFMCWCSLSPGVVYLMVCFEMGTMGRLVCVNLACPLESKLESLEKACFVLSLCSLSCRKQGEPTEKVKAAFLIFPLPLHLDLCNPPPPHVTSHDKILH